MPIEALTVPQRHENDDGSGIVIVNLTTENGDGVLTITFGADDTIEAIITGAAGLIPLGMWDQQ